MRFDCIPPEFSPFRNLKKDIGKLNSLTVRKKKKKSTDPTPIFRFWSGEGNITMFFFGLTYFLSTFPAKFMLFKWKKLVIQHFFQFNNSSEKIKDFSSEFWFWIRLGLSLGFCWALLYAVKATANIFYDQSSIIYVIMIIHFIHGFINPFSTGTGWTPVQSLWRFQNRVWNGLRAFVPSLAYFISWYTKVWQ